MHYNMSKITDYFNRDIRRTKINKVKIHPENVYTLMFDGGSRGNPGVAGAGFVIYKNGEEIFAGCAPLGTATNNFAEYRALELGLQCAIKKDITNLVIKGDSQLVLNQVTNKWRVKSIMLSSLYKNIRQLLEKLDTYQVEHVRRKFNKRADELANMAMDGNILTN